MELFSNGTDMINYVRFYYQKHPQNSIYVSVVTGFSSKVFVLVFFFRVGCNRSLTLSLHEIKVLDLLPELSVFH